MTGSTKNDRINGFDALRTIAMWLGIVLHSIIAYKLIPQSGWPHDPQFNLGFFDWLYDYIHIFRMPLFFLVAGFFTRLVMKRSGPKYFIIQRFRRIVIPFLIGIVTIVPLTMLPFNYYRFFDLQGMHSRNAWHTALVKMAGWNGLAHLWFLYYLILFYAMTLAAVYLPNQRKPEAGGKKQYRIREISLSGLLVVTAVLFGILSVYKEPVPPIYTGLKPHIFHILYYGLFFLCGWLIQTNMDSIHSLKKPAFFLWVAGTGLSVFIYLAAGSLSPAISLFLAALETITLVAGFTGLFLKYFHAESKIWRYCSDAAYWVYLFHMGVVAALQVLFLHSAVPPALRFPIILVSAFGTSLLSYQYLVRYTVIGEYLHGKRSRPA
jgi:glucans biosynthesis protein C